MATLQQVRDALRLVSEAGVTPAELVAEAMAVGARDVEGLDSDDTDLDGEAIAIARADAALQDDDMWELLGPEHPVDALRRLYPT